MTTDKTSDNPEILAIYDVIAHLRDTLTHKNTNYGSSAFERPYLHPNIPAVDAILIRMSDKINRLHNIMQNNVAVCDETIDDTVLDLAGYCVLFLANRKRKC